MRTTAALRHRIWWAMVATAMAVSTSLSTSVRAADYPDHLLTIIVPFAVGGPTDVSARILADALARDTGASFVIQNAPGAGATIGATRAAHAKPDGYTMLWGSGSSLAMTPHMYGNVNYDPIRSFEPIGLVASQPFILVVNPDRGFKSLADLIAYAKANPGKLNYASTGAGSSAQLITELFKRVTGVSATHVPYNGGAPAVMAVRSGDVDFFFDTPTTTVPLIKTGKLLALAVTSATRWADIASVPTLQELGYANFDATTWFGVVVPAGTPPDRIAYLSRHMTTVLGQAPVVAALKGAGFAVEPSDPEAFRHKIAAENVRWSGVIRDAGIKLE